jgi:dUTP pyrophosphatase
MVKVKIKKLIPGAILPHYSHKGDAGLDIYSTEDFVLTHEMRHAVSTGISMELPKGYVSLIWDKSGLAAKKGITVLGGVIDAHYRGEYKIILYNTEKDDFVIRKGDKIAQVLIQPIETAEIEEVEELSETSRGEGRFGSTGGSNI